MRIWRNSFRMTGIWLPWSMASRIIIAFVAGALFGAILMGYATKAEAQTIEDFEDEITGHMLTQGLQMYSTAFEDFKYDQTLYHRHTVKDINIIIVAHSDQMPKMARDVGAYGYTDANTKTIWILGRINERTNQIVINEAVLGHELMHILSHGSRFFYDPDMLYPHMRKFKKHGYKKTRRKLYNTIRPHRRYP